jgi:glucosylceramidase
MRTSLRLPLSLSLVFCSAAVRGAAQSQVAVYETAQMTAHRLTRVADAQLAPGRPLDETRNYVFVDAGKAFQTVIGIGGALTDAAAETYYKLPEPRRHELMRAYFDPADGIGYNFGRTHINSCDFSSESYCYVKDGDTALATFSVEHDLRYRVPFIKEAIAAAGGKLRLLASPWSPPAWMKGNGDMLHGGTLKPEYRESWARYYVAFIRAYEKEGIPIWGLTVQNEPLAVQTFESQYLTAEGERDFIKNFLGPTLVKNGLADRRLMIWDHNRTFMYQRVSVILDDPEAAKYVWGVAYHWYSDPAFGNVAQVREAYPQAHLMLTEACDYPYDIAKIHDWNWGEQYGAAMIEDFNNGAEAWTDWNVLLDEKGGPNHVGNLCYAPVHADTRTGELTFMNSYYYIGHFSKFVRPGARRIISSSTKDALKTTAFLNTDGSIAVVVMNATDSAEAFSLCVGSGTAALGSPAHSILTCVITGG